MIYDLIVVGAGPAGSTSAREAASAGAAVLLLDRAKFPRDKPCGGGVNVRAARLLPFSIEPVTERTITGISVTLDLNKPFARHYDRPLCYMTQRSRLDAFLVERAIAAGAQLHERCAARSIDLDGERVVVRGDGATYTGRVLIGADGANGVVARASGLARGRRLAVALEGHYRGTAAVHARWRHHLAMDLGIIPGGYGWLFPKADHLNIGVGGWQHFAPTLRRRLDRLAAHFGAIGEPSYLRGHYLPVRIAGAPLARGRVMLAGDAAGLIDPLSGEGIYSAIYSGRLAARYALDLLNGATDSVLGYTRAIDSFLGPDLLASQRFQDVFHLMPSVYSMLLQRSDRIWETLCRLVRGDETYLDLRRRIGPGSALVDLLSYLVRRNATLSRRAGLT